MELPADFYVKPVEGHNELLSFRYGFGLEGKAVEGDTAQVVTELEDGDLLIEGLAADFSGVDREGENFTEGAFTRGIKSFLNGSSALCFHHKADQVLGRVLDLQENDKGLWFKARVDGAIKDHPSLGTVYNQIKRGTIRGVSVGGFFKRSLTPDGPRISDVDLTEISCTAVPTHAGPSFAVVAGKALEDLEIPDKPEVEGDIRADDERAIKYAIEELQKVFDRIDKRGEGQDEDEAKIVSYD